MALIEAMMEELDRRELADRMNAQVINSLPEKDKRGTFDWWAALCRQNTGSHFLDSGGHYGYIYEKPVSDVRLWAAVGNGEIQYFSINTIHYLNELLDAADEIAIAVEELLYWYGDNVDAGGTWYNTLASFVNGVLYELVQLKPSGVGQYLEGLQPQHFDGPEKWSKKPGLPDDWPKTFPWDALNTVSELGRDIGMGNYGGGNTYNWESDLDQDLQFETLTIGRLSYIILQTHNGCDARGGYTRPVVALMREPEYFFSFTVDLWCDECGEQYDMAYDYIEDLKEVEIPSVMLRLDDAILPIGENAGYIDISAEHLVFLCPKCKQYTMNPYTIAYGF